MGLPSFYWNASFFLIYDENPKSISFKYA